MKKLLSLIGVMSIVGSGASAVISCGDNSNTLSPDQKTANALAAKVKNKNLILPAVTTNLDTSNKDTQQALKTVLYEDNKGAKGLTQQEVNQYFSFSKTTLDVTKAVAVTATITVKEATATVDLMVNIANGATSIVEQIQNRNLVIPYKSGAAQWNIDDNDFLPLLRTNLLEKNPSLKKYSSSDFALKDIKVKGKPAEKNIAIKTETELEVTVVSNNDNTSAPVDLFVYPYGAASTIADKITDTDVTVALNDDKAADYNTNNADFRRDILQQLEINNNLTITAEKDTLSVPKDQSVPPFFPTNIKVSINVPTTTGSMDTAEKDITVITQYANTANQVIDAINYTIGTNGTIVLPTGIANPDLTNQDVKDAIFNAIKKTSAAALPLPSGAVSDDMTYTLVSGGGTALTGNQANAIRATYTFDNAGDVQTATTTFNVYLPLDRAHQVIAMFKYLSNKFWANILDGYFGGLLANWNSNKDLTNPKVIESLLYNAVGFINPLVLSNMALGATALGELRISAASGSGTALTVTKNVADDTSAVNIVVKYGDDSNAPETTIKALMLSPAATLYISYSIAVSYAATTPGGDTWLLADGTDPDIKSADFKDKFMDAVLETTADTGYPFDFATYENLINFTFASDEELPNNTLTPGQTSEIYIIASNKNGAPIGFNQTSIDQFKYAKVQIRT